MKIPTNIDLNSIIESSDTATSWLAIETIRFINEKDSGLALDVATNTYMRALSYAFTVALDAFIDGEKIIDQQEMVDMLIEGTQALIKMGYVLGYQAAEGKTDAS